VIDGIQEEARRHGFHLNLATGLSDAGMKIDYLRQVSNGGVDGWLMGGQIEPEVIEYLREHHLPVVFLGDITIPEVGFTTVYGDTVQGAYLAVKYLLGLGHKRIIYLGCYRDKRLNYYSQRMGGYYRALAEEDIPPDPDLLCDPDHPPGLEEYLKRSLETSEPATAVFGSTDILAIKSLDFLFRNGIAVPDKVSVVGCDNMPICAHTQPPLSSVNVQRHTIGVLGFRKLIELINNPEVPPATILVPVELRIRESTGPAPENRKS
jgi:DNA-binding LacI/PurR family transcriptional regulator